MRKHYLYYSKVLLRSFSRALIINTQLKKSGELRKTNWIKFVLLLLVPFDSQAQLEKVFVETYYISDTVDATDTTGGGIIAGTKTYRVYIDLAAGSSLNKIYGDANHALKFSSTSEFFNNIADGQTFAKDFSKSRYLENTVALDTWLTLGQTTRNGLKTWFGIPKSQDADGSFIGGINNDGGSAGITDGLLRNNDPEAGIPLTQADGMDTMATLPNNWADYGFVNSGSDSTIFGSLVPGKTFISYSAVLQNSGVTGVLPDSNQILIAQLTTTGEISFEINIEIADSVGNIIKYVANDSVLQQGEIHSRYLKFPFEAKCGCPDAKYIEFLSDRDCDDNSLCQSLIVFGCMDPNACNL